MNNFGEKVSFIWSVADLLRGPYRPNQYKDVMLPLTVLRRLDCVLEPTKEKVLERLKKLQGGKVKNVEPILCRVTGVPFYNTSRYTFEKLKGDPNNIAANLTNYIKGFSRRAREIIEHFGFEEHIAKLDKADRLYLVVSRFCEIDLHPDVVSNIEMGYIFEELIRRFNEASNEEAGDHFTPREVIRLMVNLIFMPDSDILTTKGIVKTLYDPACGTGGMLSVAEDYVRELNPDARLEVFGQDYNSQAYAICGSDMMIKGQDIEHIAFGDSFTDDRFPRHRFDYMLANPPFGVEWKPEAEIAEGKRLQEAILSALNDLSGMGVVKNRDRFVKMLKEAFREASIKVPASLFKAILMALAERDETADICTDAKGNPEPDPELRDYENVPLKEDVLAYFEREVLPHVPDAWIDHSKTKIGYEINFNRYFYKYTPPRPLEEIEADLKKIEQEIADMLAEVTE